MSALLVHAFDPERGSPAWSTVAEGRGFKCFVRQDDDGKREYGLVQPHLVLISRGLEVVCRVSREARVVVHSWCKSLGEDSPNKGVNIFYIGRDGKISHGNWKGYDLDTYFKTCDQCGYFAEIVETESYNRKREANDAE